MNKQEIFDTVTAHLRTMDRASINPETDTCAYRGEGGSKCAIGALIPDDMYSPDYEDKGVYGIISIARSYPDEYKLPEYFDDNEYLLADLQAIAHDENRHLTGKNFRDSVEECLKNIAKDYELVYTPPKNLL